MTLPAESGCFPLLDGLTVDEIAELVAEVARGPWAGGKDDRGLHADLIREIAELFDEPITVPRLAASLRVIRGRYAPDRETALTDVEFARLSGLVEQAGATERDRAEIHLLSTVLDALAPESATVPRPPRWSRLTIVATDADTRRKKALDRLLFHRVLRDLSGGRIRGHTVLMVAGAASLDLESLETMAREARRCGVPLVLLMEKLRDELTQLLGRSGSATIFMRLGNADEARAAATHIGRGHKLVLSRLTEQVGRSLTTGSAESVGAQDGEHIATTTTTGTTTSSERSTGMSRERHPDRFGLPMGHGPRTVHDGSTSGVSSSTSRAESVGRSRSRSWQTTVRYSAQVAGSTSETYGRTYDFHTEPTEFQDLAPTAFVLVEPGAAGRRVVMGDCNPGIALLDGLSLPPGRA